MTDQPAPDAVRELALCQPEHAEPVAEIAREGGGGRDGSAGDRMPEAQFRGMQHLAGHAGKIGAAGAEVLPVAQDRVPDVVQMDPDLVGAAGFDGNRDMRAARRTCLHGNLSHVADGGQVVHGYADVQLRFRQVAGDQRMIPLADPALLELGDQRAAGVFVLGKKHAPGGVLVETVDGPQGGQAKLIAQAGFQGFFAGGEQSRRLLGHEKKRIVQQDADGGGRGRLGGQGGGEHFDRVAGLEQMPGHPDAPAVDEHQAVIEQTFGCASRKAEVFRQMSQQFRPVAPRGRQAAKGGGAGCRAFHAGQHSAAQGQPSRRKGEKRVRVS